MNWLVTGFGPFEDVLDNVTGRVAPLLGHQFEILEVSYHAVDEFISKLDPSSFDAILALGHDKRAAKIRVETLGRNVVCSRPDVRGYLPENPPIPDLPDTSAASLWALLDLNENEELTISDDAGGYLCNYMLFRAATTFPDKFVGFLHLPTADVVVPAQQAAAIRELIELAENAMRATPS